MPLGSSSRISLSLSVFSRLGATRGVLHRARPPRRPVLASPHTPKQQLPTSGTSHPVAPPSTPSVLSTSASLSDTGLTFCHSPPPSAPSYKTGAVPDFIKWTVGSQSVRLSGEEGAVELGKHGARVWYGEKVEWDQQVVEKIKEMRAEGKSRREIGESLQIPSSLHRLIPRVAPLSHTQAVAKRQSTERQKASWGYQKRLDRDIRQKRKEFW
ncbi:hypothetical protein L204_100069 [Cryptococcus depauperatus]|nr:hypothetical protein L204_02449 [Cryptococcus depauperatus CBS 7855]